MEVPRRERRARTASERRRDSRGVKVRHCASDSSRTLRPGLTCAAPPALEDFAWGQVSRPLRTGLTYAAPPALRGDGGEAQTYTAIDTGPLVAKGGRERRLEDDAIRATLRCGAARRIFPGPYGPG
jgi:hypothetical protein